MVRDTSIESYNTIKENGLLSKLKWKTYSALFDFGPCTAGELFQRAGWNHGKNNHNISSRLGELRNMEVVTEIGKTICSVTGMTVIKWDVTSKLPKKLPKKEKIKCHHCKGRGYFVVEKRIERSEENEQMGFL